MPLQQGTHRQQTGISSLDTCISPDHPVRLIDALVKKLDLEKLQIALPQSQEGRPAFHPKILLKLYLYGYMNSIRTSRNFLCCAQNEALVIIGCLSVRPKSCRINYVRHLVH